MPKIIELIADIGGSSSRWALLLADGSDQRLMGQLPGFNPAVHAPETFTSAAKHALAEALDGATVPERLTVYGAGCGTDERRQRMREALANIVTAGEVIIETDLLGAARGMCGDAPGLVLILGTGMNAGRYDGTALHTPMPSLGWILGDEGSGADIGKHFLNDAVHGRVPPSVMQEVFGKDQLPATEALHVLSGSGSPSSAVAALAGKLAAAVDHPYVQELLAARFAALGSLLRNYFGSHGPCALVATGGIAKGFNKTLGTSLASFGFDLQRVEADPMEGLIAWHRARLLR